MTSEYQAMCRNAGNLTRYVRNLKQIAAIGFEHPIRRFLAAARQFKTSGGGIEYPNFGFGTHSGRFMNDVSARKSGLDLSRRAGMPKQISLVR
ncbi:hypothetical protein GOB99_30385 [Sinorhizobium meliloti]|nr:hypothetical protein [Sinorhizobium meliloti]MDX0240823.1 hypothetical protein [Sinorhizobium meliloti]